MRVAFVGKGGVGKSSVAGTFARVLAARGAPVLALDSDPMPGLAFSIGMPQTDAGLPDELVEPYDDGDGRTRYRLPAGTDTSSVALAHAAHGPDGLRYLQLGKARGPRWDNARAHIAFQHVLDDPVPAGWSVVGDLPGGTRQPFMTWGRYAQTFVVVVEPTAASVVTGRRLARLTGMRTGPRVAAVVNKVRVAGDADDVAARIGLPLLGSVPFDPALAEADRLGRAVIDHEPDCPTITAVRSLVDAVLTETQTEKQIAHLQGGQP